jgi:hypothetical protein
MFACLMVCRCQVQRIGDGRTGRVLGERMNERSSDTVCGLHRARGDEECEFLG